MIKLEHTEVTGWEAAIRGMRNPMNSWDKSDTFCNFENCSECPDRSKCDHEMMPGPPAGRPYRSTNLNFNYIGPNDHDLMMRLARAGSVDAKYRRMINVTVDITAPLYWWKEFDTYKIGTVANSCSTMHKIAAKEFALDDFSYEHLFKSLWGEAPNFRLMNDAEHNWRDLEMDWHDSHGAYRTELDFDEDCDEWIDARYAIDVLEETIYALNHYRKKYLETKDKKYWWQMIQLLPSSYNQKRTVQLNYEVLAGIYPKRKNHKLDEWHDFCDWIKSLPFSEVITLDGALSKPMEKEDIRDALTKIATVGNETLSKIGAEFINIKDSLV